MTQTERRGSEEDVVVAEIVCASCGRRLPGDAAACIHCGRSATKGRLPPAGGADVRPETAPPIADAPQPQRLIDHVPVVLTLLLAVMGPLALPILWASRAFSTRAKILWTVICWIELALLLAAAWAAVAYLIRTIEQYS